MGRIYNTSEARSRGYTVAVVSVFSSREDLDYYDKQCEAHKRFKEACAGHHEGPETVLSVFIDSDRP